VEYRLDMRPYRVTVLELGALSRTGRVRAMVRIEDSRTGRSDEVRISLGTMPDASIGDVVALKQPSMVAFCLKGIGSGQVIRAAGMRVVDA